MDRATIPAGFFMGIPDHWDLRCMIVSGGHELHLLDGNFETLDRLRTSVRDRGGCVRLLWMKLVPMTFEWLPLPQTNEFIASRIHGLSLSPMKPTEESLCGTTRHRY